MQQLVIRHLPGNVAGTGEKVRIAFQQRPNSQLQEAEGDFSFALTDTERRDIQWYLEEYLQFPRGEFKKRAERIEANLITKGEELFHATFGDTARERLYNRVSDSLSNTRIVIETAKDDLSGVTIPWEMLRDPHRDYGILARQAHSFVRSQQDLTLLTADIPQSNTFNILLVICRPNGPKGEDKVPFQSVARRLLELFRPYRDRIRVDILRPPTLATLAKTLEDKRGFYHIVHFDGHGAFPTGAQMYSSNNASGVLLFENEDGTQHLVSGADLGQVLSDKGVPVTLLNACQSGMTRPDAIYPSVGNQLLRAGVGGVVAMAYSVYVSTAVEFMARLYEGLIAGEELGQAVQKARNTLAVQNERPTGYGKVSLQDWIVPVLFEAAPIRPVEKPIAAPGQIRLTPNTITDEQVKAGAEIDCPRPPDFGFIGRDGVLLTLERAFRKNDIVLLKGMAGVGKTETALGFARWWAETGGLEGPVFFTSFQSRMTLPQVVNRIGKTFHPTLKAQGIEWSLLDDPTRHTCALQLLKQIPCLIIWDNFEPVNGFPTGAKSDWLPDERDSLLNFLRDLRGGETKILLTSRREEPWLGQIYRPVALGGLQINEAQELAEKVLERAGIGTKNAADYRDLLKYLNGNPLAIRVILSEIKHVEPKTLLERLQRGEANLTDDEEQGRTRSLAASLNYRLDHLPEDDRKRLALLGMFQGFVDNDVLAMMCAIEGAPSFLQGCTPGEWLRPLDAAAEIGLLNRIGNGLYEIHPAVPWFFHDRMQESFQDTSDWLTQAYIQAYSQYRQSLDSAIRTNTQTAVTLLSWEESNFRMAIARAYQHMQVNKAAGITQILYHFWDMLGRWSDLEFMTTELQSHTCDQDGESLPGCAYAWIIMLAHQQGIASNKRDFETQERINRRLVAHFASEGDEKNQAIGLFQLGKIAQERRQFDEAERWYQQSLAI